MEYHFQNFYVTRLREAVDASATKIYVDNPPSITSGVLVLESKNVSKREIIYFNSVDGYALNDCVRGLEDTVPNTHNQGATVEQSVTAGQLDQVINSAMQQGMGDDQDAPMSQWAVKNTLNAIQQLGGEQFVLPALAFSVSDTQPTPDPDGKVIVWFEPLE